MLRRHLQASLCSAFVKYCLRFWHPKIWMKIGSSHGLHGLLHLFLEFNDFLKNLQVSRADFKKNKIKKSSMKMWPPNVAHKPLLWCNKPPPPCTQSHSYFHTKTTHTLGILLGGAWLQGSAPSICIQAAQRETQKSPWPCTVRTALQQHACHTHILHVYNANAYAPSTLTRFRKRQSGTKAHMKTWQRHKGLSAATQTVVDGTQRTAEFWAKRCVYAVTGNMHVGAAAGGTADHTKLNMINGF